MKFLQRNFLSTNQNCSLKLLIDDENLQNQLINLSREKWEFLKNSSHENLFIQRLFLREDLDKLIKCLESKKKLEAELQKLEKQFNS